MSMPGLDVGDAIRALGASLTMIGGGESIGLILRAIRSEAGDRYEAEIHTCSG